MAGFLVHIAQAVHNEKLAEYLLDKPYHDWAITASFYAAIHYFEACLFIRRSDNSNRHSETCIPKDGEGKLKYGYHAWRAHLISELFSQQTWKAFRRLRNAGHEARYLAPFPERNASTNAFLNQPAYENFEPETAKKLVNSLEQLKRDLKVEMAELIHELELHTELGADTLIVLPILLRFSSKGGFLHSGREALREALSDRQMAAVERCMESKGYYFTN
jgi:hypothetical protein